MSLFFRRALHNISLLVCRKAQKPIRCGAPLLKDRGSSLKGTGGFSDMCTRIDTPNLYRRYASDANPYENSITLSNKDQYLQKGKKTVLDGYLPSDFLRKDSDAVRAYTTKAGHRLLRQYNNADGTHWSQSYTDSNVDDKGVPTSPDQYLHAKGKEVPGASLQYTKAYEYHTKQIRDLDIIKSFGKDKSGYGYLKNTLLGKPDRAHGLNVPHSLGTSFSVHDRLNGWKRGMSTIQSLISPVVTVSFVVFGILNLSSYLDKIRHHGGFENTYNNVIQQKVTETANKIPWYSQLNLKSILRSVRINNPQLNGYYENNFENILLPNAIFEEGATQESVK